MERAGRFFLSELFSQKPQRAGCLLLEVVRIKTVEYSRQK